MPKKPKHKKTKVFKNPRAGKRAAQLAKLQKCKSIATIKQFIAEELL